MSMWIRTIRIFLAVLFRPALDLFGQSTLRFRVMPDDLDINVHMNNARYLALMDLGRYDLILRSGMWRAMWQHKWQAVLGASLVRYRRPLKPFQRINLTTRLICWDEKFLYIEHRIAAGEVLSCLVMVRAAFVGKTGVIPPVQLAATLGFTESAPELPAWAGAWREADKGIDLIPQAASA